MEAKRGCFEAEKRGERERGPMEGEEERLRRESVTAKDEQISLLKAVVSINTHRREPTASCRSTRALARRMSSEAAESKLGTDVI